jgi:hypothetical protein
MTPQDFIAKWGCPHGVPGPAYALNEEQGAQSHFLDLCELLDVPKPGSREGYRFEEKSALIGGKTGYADVFMRGVFAWENKAPGKNLDNALRQLLTYSLALENPPILVVSDRLTIRIHTQFTGHPSQTHQVALAELEQPDKRALLKRIWLEPGSFKPRQTSRDITEAAARSFAKLADSLRKHWVQKLGSDHQELGSDHFLRSNGCSDPNSGPHAKSASDPNFWVSHFLTQCVFCFFAEDVGLFPARLLERLLSNQQASPARLTQGLQQLFATMQGGGLFGVDDIPWFNGGLFQSVHVPPLGSADLPLLREAAALNWSAIDVSIFGTLFERGLDPAKRSQLGAHYTDPATIERIINPVLRRPLLQQWEHVAQEIRWLTAKSTKKGDKAYQAAKARFVGWLEMLRAYRVLDPACGSGNFLFLGLKALKDIEHKSHLDAASFGLDREADLVTGPHNVLGIELNEYAAELARVTVWIGELQWRMAHGYEFKTNPVLEPLDHIECRDALLTFAMPNTAAEMGSVNAALQATEATWPQANVVIGNPPFLGGSKKRRELGDEYFKALDTVFAGRVPGGADLVCYWFDKARQAIERAGLQAAGLVSTNSIRGGSNRKVLDAICQSSRIFEAWSDEAWVNEGAAVRVSLVCFGRAEGARLDGAVVDLIHADLTAGSSSGDDADLTTAQHLPESASTCFMGASKKAPFDIDGPTARQWLNQPNPHSKSNALVVRPLCNGIDLTRRWGDRWIVDFGTTMVESDAMLFEAPYAYIKCAVRPIASKNSDKQVAKNWWRHARPRVDMRAALAPLPRYIITAAVAKHRTFIWMHSAVLPDQATLAIARADDTTFGILHSRFHELWSLRMGTSLEDRPRYTPTTCFETFPFPPGLTPADTAHQRIEVLQDGASIPVGLCEQNPPVAPANQTPEAIKTMSTKAAASAIAHAAHRLDALRRAWLNPPQWTQVVPEVVPLGMEHSPYPDRIVPRPGFEKQLAERTLTKLYNQRPTWLAQAHHALDVAVAAAYGWPAQAADWPQAQVLQHLLALNVERAATRTKHQP